MAGLKTFVLVSVFYGVLSACAGSTSLPAKEPFFPASQSSEVYAGEGTAYAWKDGAWVEKPTYNYEFIVIKRLYEGHWITIKQLYRLHPDYTGLAGHREQTLFFNVDYERSGEDYVLAISGTLGTGTGQTNGDMSSSTVELTSETRFPLRPFDRIRITQNLDRDAGTMRETVELLKLRGGIEWQFMKFEERGTVYLPPQAH